jgi:hypothetical protein
MKSAIDWIKLIFLGVFVVSVALIWSYQARVVWPRERCEAHGDWWDDEDNVCAVPMPIWTFTRRMPGQAASNSAAKPSVPPNVAKPKS